ncbi:MAG: flagellar hook-basal body complex protein [Candidatus Riflebacteria bacterium]|nr:flagellar hook-basal body complex protein [Candidatus Riflebacteria bacterium]
MLRSLFTGVTGLKQFQTKMDVVSNNIANVDTTGFKRGRAMFADLFSETIRHGQQSFGDFGSQNPMQIGLGTKIASIDTIMTQGKIENTGRDNDIAIEGDGFFMVKGFDSNIYYTRDGNLNVSDSHDLIMTNTGSKIQGWSAMQDPRTGNLEMRETDVVPYDINIARYLKKHAHQTNEITYSCNLQSSSPDRDIEFGVETLTFIDSADQKQDLRFKFKKLDAENWLWTAHDDTEGNVATGTLKCDEDGTVLESTVEPAGLTSTLSAPYFTYDPDGNPQPGSATMPINKVTNQGNGLSSGVTVSGNLVKDETVEIIFDGGDPTRAVSYRVVGSERGFIHSGTLGGTQARFAGDPVTFGLSWTPAANTSFTVTDSQFAVPRTATVSFVGGTTYTASEIVDTINNALANDGVRATAYFDAVTSQLQIVSNEIGERQNLTIGGAIGNFADLGLTAGTQVGTGAGKAEVYSDLAMSAAFAADNVDVTADVQLVVTDRHGRAATIEFPDIVAGVNQIYSRGAILAEINSQLVANNVSANAAFLDTDNDGSPDQLMISSNVPGSGERVILTGTNIDQLGLAGGSYSGTAAVSHFEYGGLTFDLTEGTNHWLPNESLSFVTTAEKGAASSVNIYVPQPGTKKMAFATNVNNHEYKIEGAVSKGAQHKTNIVIYDSLGTPHGMVTTWEHTDKTKHEWTYKMSYSPDDPEILAWLKDPANNILDPESPTDEELERANDSLITDRTGKMYFQNDGKIDVARSYIPSFSLQPRGSNPLKIDLATDLITQFDSQFTTKAENQDGYAMGLLQKIYFEEDGVVRGVYSNGQKQPIAQLAIATFNNPEGLEKKGNNLYAFAPGSGLAVVSRAGVGLAGKVVANSLEMSNVDLSQEFTDMIVTQRAFQANSRVITTSDELLQELVNLKR